MLKLASWPADTNCMGRKGTIAFSAAALLAALSLSMTSAKTVTAPEQPAAKAKDAPAKVAPDAPLIAKPSPAPVIYTIPPATVAGGRATARINGHLSSLPQYVAMGLDTSPVSRIASIAVIDTAIAANGRAFAGRVSHQRGNGAAGANEHGTLISAALTASYSAEAMSNGGAATPARLLFYGCALAGGIDMDCALSSLESATATGVRVINLSFETRAPIPADLAARWQGAVNAAGARGVLIVAAAGDGPGLPFPASLSGVVSVSRLAGSRVVNPAAYAAAPGSDLVVVNGAGSLVATGGSSYSTAFVSAVAARIAGAKPGIGIALLRRSVSGRTTMPRAAKIAGVRLAPIGRPGCARRVGKTITWAKAAKAAKAVRYRVTVGGLPIIVKGQRLVTARRGTVTVQGIGAYGTLGPASRAC